MAAPYFCILPSDWPKWTYSSIQVQLYGCDNPIFIADYYQVKFDCQQDWINNSISLVGVVQRLM